MSTTISQTTPYIYDFDEPGESRLEMLGGKCASLVSLTAAGMPVPPGFTVTTSSYDAFVAETGISEQIRSLLDGLDPADTDRVEEVSAQIREAICSRPVPDAVRQETRTAYERLQSRFEEPVPVAVRSSATAEDLPGASFAGQQDTYLGLQGIEAVTEHIRQCWASLYTARAITYRMRNGIPDEGLSMAVAVQKMVNARVAGVAITMNPTTGDRSQITVDSSWGVGEMVVSGEVTPDNFVLDKVTLVTVGQTIGDKHAELQKDPETGDLIEVPVDEQRRKAPSLTEQQLMALGTLAKRAERHYGCPQDIEWALDADLPEGEDLLLLQSRPETVFSGSTTPAGDSQPGAQSQPAGSTAGAATGFSMSGITSSMLNGRSG